MSDDTQRPIFGMPEPGPVYPRRILDMWRVWGKTPGKTCKTCRHLVQQSQANTWYKCEISYVSSSVASDWRVRWPACGQWDEESEA